MGTTTKQRASVELELSDGQRAILDRFRARANEAPGTIFDPRSGQTAWILARLEFDTEGNPATVLRVIDDAFGDFHLASIGLTLEVIYVLWSARHKPSRLEKFSAATVTGRA